MKAGLKKPISMTGSPDDPPSGDSENIPASPADDRRCALNPFCFTPCAFCGEDFLDNISKLEIQHPPPSDNGKAESSAGQQRPDDGSTTSKQAPQKPAVVRKAANQNNKADNTIAALRKQNAELSAAVKAAEKTRDETTRTLTAQIAALEARNTAPDVDQSASLNALNKKMRSWRPPLKPHRKSSKRAPAL